MKNSIGKPIGKNISELRIKHGFSRIDLATELGYSTANYGKIESGKLQLDCQGLITLCKYIGCKPERIVYGKAADTDVYIPDYFLNYSEMEKRRLFRMLYIVFNCQQMHFSNSFHKMFGSDLFNEIPVGEINAIPYILEHERKSRDLTRRKMIDFLDISKNKYYSLLGGEPLSDIDSLTKLKENLGYDMTFLLSNIVDSKVFLSEISPSWSEKEQKVFQKQLDLCLTMDNLSIQFIEMQSKRR